MDLIIKRSTKVHFIKKNTWKYQNIVLGCDKLLEDFCFSERGGGVLISNLAKSDGWPSYLYFSFFALLLDVFLDDVIYCVAGNTPHICTQPTDLPTYRCTSAFILRFLRFTTNACVDETFLSFPLDGKCREKGTQGLWREGGWFTRSSQLNSLYIYIFSTPFWLINFDYSQEKNWHYSVFFLAEKWRPCFNVQSSIPSGSFLMLQRMSNIFPVFRVQLGEVYA
jgi:hypothetical protein